MSEFFTADHTVLNSVSERMLTDPVYQDRYDAISELRSGHVEHPARVHSLTDQWMRVASFQGPLLDLARVLDPNFLLDKKKFYKFLDDNPQYCAYDRRRGRRT